MGQCIKFEKSIRYHFLSMCVHVAPIPKKLIFICNTCCFSQPFCIPSGISDPFPLVWEFFTNSVIMAKVTHSKSDKRPHNDKAAPLIFQQMKRNRPKCFVLFLSFFSFTSIIHSLSHFTQQHLGPDDKAHYPDLQQLYHLTQP